VHSVFIALVEPELDEISCDIDRHRLAVVAEDAGQQRNFSIDGLKDRHNFAPVKAFVSIYQVVDTAIGEVRIGPSPCRPAAYR